MKALHLHPKSFPVIDYYKALSIYHLSAILQNKLGETTTKGNSCKIELKAPMQNCLISETGSTEQSSSLSKHEITDCTRSMK